MKRQQFNRLIADASFSELFITEMAWDNPTGSTALPHIDIDSVTYQPKVIAEKRGFKVLVCEVDSIPATSTCHRIDLKVRRFANDYIMIFALRSVFHHLWIAPVRKIDKRDIVTTEYTSADQAEFIFQKIDNLSFAFDEKVTITDVRQRVNESFAVNSEKITKDFYAGFKKEHKAFVEFIHGIEGTDTAVKDRQWYASVMLNRLMFCYFIQKKGFLNGDKEYLKKKLEWVQHERGQGHFFRSFYLGFLRGLFHDGLNMPQHDDEFEKTYGRIPYLNGGMFEEHKIEHDYEGIDIDDEAFERLFTFFDHWNWHLDTRITASGKDINPDVLGYIFEQYINDRAQMGAYYTKEDITEYIGRNCILPFLFDRVRNSTTDSSRYFAPNGFVWHTLRNSGDRYIFDAVKKGYSEFDKIPDSIARGIITGNMRKEYSETPVGELPDSHTPLAELRSEWNSRTPERWGLPNEIWRETIDRLQRCDTILSKINQGEITSINDFITYNLDIRNFAQDLLAKADNRFIGWFYHALQDVTILDPTCGSGAFLFAAMNILEPLYELCIDRMQEFNCENPAMFKTELAEITDKYRSNIKYFIFKSIILRNLYGVDIMVEATEIAKLRLFLKMVAVVDVDRRADNLGLDPLPDIDFNIRCGNTLVGYATKVQLFKDLNDCQGSIDVFLANEEFKEQIEKEVLEVASTYKLFKEVQLKQEENMLAFKQAKQELRKRLFELNDKLNRRHHLATSPELNYEEWLSSHQPFNWFTEFYQIIEGNNGFDVIIGNPPYVEYSKIDKSIGKSIKSLYKITNYTTEDCDNLYAFVLERSNNIMNEKGYIGMIVPLSGHSTSRMANLSSLYQSFGLHLHLNLSADANPQKLFEGVKFRLCIFLGTNNGKGSYSSKYTRWMANERNILFSALVKYVEYGDYSYRKIIPKISSKLLIDIFSKIKSQDQFFGRFYGQNIMYYHNAPVNWIRAHSTAPYFWSERDGEGITSQLKTFSFPSMQHAKVAMNIVCSSIFFNWWISHSDCYHLNIPELHSFGINVTQNLMTSLSQINNRLTIDMQNNSCRRVYNYKTTGRVEYDEFYMKLSKPIIDEIDTVLARHYGFTEEELDFIINYDIKYRMGDELNNSEE